MKKHIVILVGSYYPNYSAVGICAKNIVDELKKKYYKVSIISDQVIYSNRKDFFLDKDEHIYRVSSFLYDDYLKNLHLLKDGNNILIRLRLLLIRMIRFLYAIFQKNNVDKYYVKSYYETLNMIYKNEPFDIVVPFCFPFESCLAASRFCNEYKIKNIPFLMDRFAASSSKHKFWINAKIKFKNHLKLEDVILKNCTSFLYLNSWKSHLGKYHIKNVAKGFLVEHPLLKQNHSEMKLNYDSQKIHLVYTGGLIKKVRNPKIAFKTLARIIDNNMNIVIHLYTTGDCIGLINRYVKKYPENFINHGFVTSQEAHAAISSADFLLSIGNSDIQQFPSKNFEYISTGKPIIHFYKKENDPVNEILYKYKNCILINELKHENSFELCAFLKGVNLDVTWKDISDKFISALPSTSVNIIEYISEQ